MRLESSASLLNPMSQFSSITNLTEQQKKNPKIRQILKNF